MIAEKEFKLCGKYLDLKEGIPRLTKLVQTMIKFHKTGEFTEKQFVAIDKVWIDECATYVALLVINGRRKEAEKLDRALRKEWKDTAYHEALDGALKGELPKPASSSTDSPGEPR